MLNRPVLKYCYHIEFLNNDKIILISEEKCTILQGKQYSLVLKEIQNRGLVLAELVQRLDGALHPLQVYTAVQVLENEGLIIEENLWLPEYQSAYWISMGMELENFKNQLEKKIVYLESTGQIKPEPFREVLEGAGVCFSATSSTAALKIIITENYCQEMLRKVNREALISRQPWMLVKPVGTEIWIGPVFTPGETGCWECLEQRLLINNPVNTLYQHEMNTDAVLPYKLSYLPHTIQIASHLTALEVVRWLYSRSHSDLEGTIISFHTKKMETIKHTLVKRPQCPCCGDKKARFALRPIVLHKSERSAYSTLGGYREKSAEETINRYIHHVSRITGVVQSLQPYHSREGEPVYNYSSGHSIAYQSKTLFWLNQHMRSASGGKGRNCSQAKAGALCEAIERYCLAYHGDEYTITGSLQSLGDKAIHPNACMNYSEDQFKRRSELNPQSVKFYDLIPIPFDESMEMDWSPLYSLTEKSFKYLPSCYCYAQYPAEDEENLFSYPDSNGCAAGNSMEEAILQGLLELVERDSTAIWWYNRLTRRAVNLHSFHDSYFDELITFYASLDRSLYVLDITSDLGIPSFAAISHRTDGNKQNIIFAFGAHVDAHIGVERALIELNQILPIVNVPGEMIARGNFRTEDKNFIRWLETATMENNPYLVPDTNAWPLQAGDYRPLCEPNIYDSIMVCLDRMSQRGLEVLVLDLTRQDIGLSVVKVVVPGMRHFWQRLGPGRLYDVPVTMGWLNTENKETGLNPVALFI